MSSFRFPSFDTLADAQKYDGVEVLGVPISDFVAEILPLSDLEACNGRIDCRGCDNLLMSIPGEVAGVFISKESNPSFALCNRGDSSNMRRLLTLQYPLSHQERILPIIDMGSSQCPREFGDHQ